MHQPIVLQASCAQMVGAVLKSVVWTVGLIAAGWGIMEWTTPTPEELLKAYLC